MRGVLRILSAFAAIAALTGCEADDKVLDPDDVADGGGGGQADGGGNGGSTDAGNGGNGGNDAGGNGGDTDAGGGVHTAADADCDLNGAWIGRQVTRSVALSAGQFSNNWYYLELQQDGTDVVVTKHFDCGIYVKGTATVQLSKPTTEALVAHNLQAGRKGTMKKDGAGCAFTMERFWSIRGATEEMFRPTGADASKSIADVKTALPLPTKEKPAGAEDWENDGKLGSAWQVSGIVSGTRNTVQRDWTEWFTDAAAPITPSTDWAADVVVRVRFDNEENIFDPTSGLLTQGSTADVGAKHALTLKFLGRSAADQRAKDILKGTEFERCQAIQKALPFASGL